MYRSQGGYCGDESVSDESWACCVVVYAMLMLSRSSAGTLNYKRSDSWPVLMIRVECVLAYGK